MRSSSISLPVQERLVLLILFILLPENLATQ